MGFQDPIRQAAIAAHWKILEPADVVSAAVALVPTPGDQERIILYDLVLAGVASSTLTLRVGNTPVLKSPVAGVGLNLSFYPGQKLPPGTGLTVQGAGGSGGTTGTIRYEVEAV